MAEYSRTIYNFNNRIKLNDTATDSTRFVLVDPAELFDTVANNVEEELPTQPGIVDYGVKLGKGTGQVPLQVYGDTIAHCEDMIQTLKQAFNPDLLEADATYGETTKYQGYHPLTWTETVNATSRDFQMFLKATEIPQIDQDSLAGTIRDVVVKLKAKDPRKYLQQQSTLSGSGTANNVGTYPTPVVITITASGATSTSLQIANTTTGQSIYVGTALANNDVLVIDTQYHTAKKNGTDTRSLLTSSTAWWTLNPGNNTITITNGTNATISTAWYPAWPI